MTLTPLQRFRGRVCVFMFAAQACVCLCAPTVAEAQSGPPIALFTDQSETQPGLVGTYIDETMGLVVDFDWRVTQSVAGTRIDSELAFVDRSWGARAEVGLTGGSDADWDQFSVQWDGYIRVNQDGVRLAISSDDGSRFWIDLNDDGNLQLVEFIDNNWGSQQTLQQSEFTPQLSLGLYRVRVQYAEWTDENIMQLVTTAPLLPGNDVCATAYDIEPGDTERFTTSGATSSGAPVPDEFAGYTLGPDVWFQFTPSSDGIFRASTCGGSASNIDSVLMVYTGSCGALTTVVANDNHPECTPGNAEVQFVAMAGTTVFIRVASPSPDIAGSTQLSLRELSPATNDDCANAAPLPFGDGVFVRTDGATASPLSPSGPDIWYTFPAPYAGELSIFVTERRVTPSVNVWTGDCAAPTLVASATALNGATPVLTILVVAGDSPLIQLYNEDGLAGAFDITAWMTPASNDVCTSPTVIGRGDFVKFTTFGAASEGMLAAVSCDPGMSIGRDVWFEYVSEIDEAIVIRTTGPLGTEHAVEIYDGECGSLNLMSCDRGRLGTVTLDVLAGVPVKIRVAEVSGGSFFGTMQVESEIPRTLTWVSPQGGDYEDPANWDLGVVPDLDDDAIFDLDATYTVSVSRSRSLRDFELRSGSVTFAIAPGAPVGACIDVRGFFQVAASDSESASLMIEDGAISTDSGTASVYVGTGEGALGSVSLGEGSSLVFGFGTLEVGRPGFAQSGVVVFGPGSSMQGDNGLSPHQIYGTVIVEDGAHYNGRWTSIEEFGRMRVERGARVNQERWDIRGTLDLAGGSWSDENGTSSGNNAGLVIEWNDVDPPSLDWTSTIGASIGGSFEFSFAEDLHEDALSAGQRLVLAEGSLTFGISGRFDATNITPPPRPDLHAEARLVGESGDGSALYLVVDIVERSDAILAALAGATTSVESAPLGVDTADFDGDGFIDIAVTIADTAPGGFGSVQRLIRDPASPDGAPAFTEIAQLPVGREPSDVLALLLNDDPFLDLVVSNRGDDNIMVLFGDAFGGFGAPVATAVGDGPSSLAAGDFDGDGDMDIVVTNELDDASHWHVLSNDGMGGLTITDSGVDGDGRRPKRVKPADVDPDPTRGGERLDLVVLYEGIKEGPVASLDLGRVSVFRNNGDGTFAAPVGVDVGWGPAELALGDLDRDGPPDIIIANAGALDTRGTADAGDDVTILGDISVLYNRSPAPGSIAFDEPDRVAQDAAYRSIVVVDLDKDGDLDIGTIVVDAALGRGVVQLLENVVSEASAALAEFETLESDYAPTTDARRLLTDDMDGDGDEDLIVIGVASSLRSDTGVVAVLPNATPQPPDFDGDGDVDGADLGVLLGGWGSSGLTDLNGDGVTDGADLGLLLTEWG